MKNHFICELGNKCPVLLQQLNFSNLDRHEDHSALPLQSATSSLRGLSSEILQKSSSRFEEELEP